MATRGKGEGSIYKRAKDGMWCASVELPAAPDGSRRRKVICRKDKADVIRIMRETQAQVSKHGDMPTSSITLEKWMTHWLDDIAAKKLRPKTLAGHRTVMDNYIIPILGKKRLDKITAADVRKLHDVMQATPKDVNLRGETDLPADTEMLSSTYALLTHNVLSIALKVAHREGRITANPCELVDRPTVRHTEQGALDVREATKLLQHIGTRADRALWATFLLTGARRGEILGLEADRVTDVLDLSWQLQRITDITKAPANWEHRHLRSTLYLSRPKSKAGWRIVPLVEPLRSILALHMAGQTSGLIFTRDGEPWDPDGATKAWKALLVEAGLPDDVVLHGTRHTAVDMLYAAGVPEQVIMEIVGHTTRAVTRGYKTKGNRLQLTDAMDKMSKLLEA